MRRWVVGGLALLVAVTLLTVAWGGPALAQETRTRITYLLAQRVYVGDGGLVVAGDADLGDVTLNRGRLAQQATLSVAGSAAFTPTGTYQPIQATPAGAGITGVSITPGEAGALLVVTNVNTTTVQIADSGKMLLSAAITLGQYDSLTLVSDGTNWIQLATSNN